MILPARPYQVRTAFNVRAWLWIAGLSAIAVAAAPFVVRWRLGAARELLEEKRIWEEGIAATDAQGPWIAEKGVIFDDYKLDIHYRDVEGVAHRRRVELTTIRELELKAPLELRYLRGHPEQIALSAAIERIGDRWIAWYGATAFAVMMTLGLGFLAARKLRHWMDVRHAADRSTEVELVIDHIERIVLGDRFGTTKTKRFRYHCSLRIEGGELVRCRAVFNSALGRYPIFTDEAQSRLVALISPHAPRRPIIVRNDIYPFRLDANQLKALRERLGTGT